MNRSQKQLGEILIERGLITPQQLKEALEEQRRTNAFLGAILVKRGYIKEESLLKALSEQFRIPFVSLRGKYINWSIAGQFSTSLVLDLQCFPLKKDDWSITFAITNPLDVRGVGQAEQEARGYQIKLVLTSEADMKDVIGRYRDFLKGNIMKLF